MSAVMSDPATFAERLDAAMSAAGMNQTQLAAAVGVSKQTVSAWIKGRNIPQLDLACKVARALKIPLERLCADDWHGPTADEAEEP